MDEIRSAFLEFINRIPFYGYAILCIDDPHVQSIIPRIKKRFISYGLSSQAMYHGKKPKFESGNSIVNVFREEQLLGEIRLPMPGIHNVSNAIAATAVADVFDVPFELTAEALGKFPGVRRRFTHIGSVDGITIIDDYGHHPAEIKAVLQAARQIAPGRIVILFQPHRYSRTQALFEQFLTCFHDADILHIIDIYPASERPIEGVNSKALVEGIHARGHKRVRYVPDKNDLSEITESLREGDMLITLGAGDVTNLGPVIYESLKSRLNGSFGQ
jgi:UDP-N-acetylmuramate--alanine ligase